MKKHIMLLLFFVVLMSSCSSTQKTTQKSYKRTSFKAAKIIRNALAYKGTRYKYGGTTKRGMDCSGLVYVVFKKENIQLPRVSSAMATKGKTVSLRNVKRGDLLFFKTSRKNRINHVGLITSIKNGKILFIHATTHKGVIVSSLSEKYWKRAYAKAKRIL